eukprot:SAG11_NODE_15768_length_567_cov_0.688034_1_plen_129_part_10
MIPTVGVQRTTIGLARFKSSSKSVRNGSLQVVILQKFVRGNFVLSCCGHDEPVGPSVGEHTSEPQEQYPNNSTTFGSARPLVKHSVERLDRGVEWGDELIHPRLLDGWEVEAIHQNLAQVGVDNLAAQV